MIMLSQLLFNCCLGKNSRGEKSSSPRKSGIAKRISESTCAETRWMKLKTIEYVDDKGVTRKWDYVSRSTKQGNGPDAVFVIPVLRSKKSSSIDTLLVKQYRPPVEQYSIEFPAGLVDKNGETPGEAALRELKEETGYIGTVDDTLPSQDLSMTPGISDETIQIVVVNVDLDDPLNQNPKQQTEDGENVTVERVPLLVGLKDVIGESDCMPINLLYSFAVGLEIGAKHLAQKSDRTLT